jgi:HEAT repeat protein
VSGAGDPAARRRAITIAGHSGDVAVAREGLLDEEAAVRASALGALERLGALDEEALATALADRSAVVRRRAASMSACHPDVPLLASLSDPDASVVEMAAFACGEREAADAAVVSRLGELATGHPDALVREAAVAALGAIGAEGGVGAILAATHDKPAVRRRAVIALAPFEGPEVTSALTAALQDRDWQVRQAAEDLLAP